MLKGSKLLLKRKLLQICRNQCCSDPFILEKCTFAGFFAISSVWAIEVPLFVGNISLRENLYAVSAETTLRFRIAGIYALLYAIFDRDKVADYFTENIGGITMSKRYRITRAMQNDGGSTQTISLEECKQYFASKPDFTYTSVYTVAGATTMSIEGDFFMWSFGDTTIPFRHYQGDIYVSGNNEAVIPRMLEVASDLRADVVEG